MGKLNIAIAPTHTACEVVATELDENNKISSRKILASVHRVNATDEEWEKLTERLYMGDN